MVGLIVAGLALLVSRHPLMGMLACVFGAAIKAPAVIVAVFIVAETVRGLPRARRPFALVWLTGSAVAAFALVTWASRLGWGWVGALGVPGMNRSLLTPTTVIADFVSAVVGHDSGVLSITRALALLLTVAAVVYLIWRAPRIGTVRACGLALAVVVALGPIVLPWYALWGIVVLAAAGRRIERGYAIFASVVLLLVVQPSGSAMPDLVLMAAVVALTGLALVIGWRPVRRWVRQDVAAAIDDYRAGGHVAPLADLARRPIGNHRTTRPAQPESRPA